MASVTTADVGGTAQPIKAKSGRDDRIMLAFTVMIALYLIITLALPLAAMLSKSLEVRAFNYGAVTLAVDTGAGFGEPATLDTFRESMDLLDETGQARRNTALTGGRMFEGGALDGEAVVAVRLEHSGATVEFDREEVPEGETIEIPADQLDRLVLRAGSVFSWSNYITYFSTPALSQSIGNSFYVSFVTTIITVVLAFGFAYALHRTCMPFKGVFKTVAMIPILVPSLLSGLSLVYLFGNQGIIKGILFGYSIYGELGIILGCIFFTFPHALLIISTGLAISDARLYEAARALRTSPTRTFFTVTLPGARYALISAAFVVFTLTITDFGVPKVVGGDYSVLAVDIYKQVVGQQNFAMGAVVSVILLIPAVFAFAIDRFVTARQVSLLSARAVPYQPKPNRRLDRVALGYCLLISTFLIMIIAIAQYASLIKFWPYNHEFTWRHYNFDLVDGGGWASYWNSIQLGLWTALIGTAVVFVGAYIVEKGRGYLATRNGLQFLAMMPMAIPGMVLGLAYIFFFNDPNNPLNDLYRTMALLVICTITHFYTVSHLTAMTALKAMDREFESVSASLKQPVTRMFSRVTVPVCLPTILDIAAYFFVNAMTTVSAVIFLYGPATTLAAVAALNMDDAGQIQPAAAMCMMIFYTNIAARLVHAALTRGLRASQAWRTR